MFYLDDRVNNNITYSPYIYTSPLIMAISTVIRTVCAAIMIILGRKTLQYRNESENRIRNMNNLHGEEAEELNALTVLRQGVKDVLKVNLWTCVFLLPMTFVALLILLRLGTSVGSVIFTINTICATLYTLANPIIYLSCFSKIRGFWTRLFRRHRTEPED